MSGIRSIADVENIERIPLSERDSPGTPIEALERSADRWPNVEALRFFASADRFMPTWRWTYAELLAEVRAAAALLESFGLRADDVVSIVLPAAASRALAAFSLRLEVAASEQRS